MIRSDGRRTTIICDHKGCPHTVVTPGNMTLAKSLASVRGWDCERGHYCYIHKEEDR